MSEFNRNKRLLWRGAGKTLVAFSCSLILLSGCGRPGAAEAAANEASGTAGNEASGSAQSVDSSKGGTAPTEEASISDSAKKGGFQEKDTAGTGMTEAAGPSDNEGGDDAGKQGYSNEELCKMALDYYEKENDYRPGVAQVDSENGDLVTLHLFDDMGDHTATSAWYEIDRRTGRGQDTILGEEVDLVE